MKPLIITQYILKILTSDTNVKQMFGDNIYPLQAKQSTKFPFAVMQRTHTVPSYSKDGHHEYNITMTIITADDNYAGSAEGAEIIRNALELRSYSDDNISIRKITLEDAVELIIDNSFIQELTFNVNIQL